MKYVGNGVYHNPQECIIVDPETARQNRRKRHELESAAAAGAMAVPAEVLMQEEAPPTDVGSAAHLYDVDTRPQDAAS